MSNPSDPFDLGLPMVAQPPKPPRRRKRRRPPPPAADLGDVDAHTGDYRDWIGETPTGPLDQAVTGDQVDDNTEAWEREPEYAAPDDEVRAYLDEPAAQPQALPSLIDRSGGVDTVRRRTSAEKSRSSSVGGGRGMSILIGVGIAVAIAAVGVVATGTGSSEDTPTASGSDGRTAAGAPTVTSSSTAPATTTVVAPAPTEPPHYAADGCVQQLDGTGGAVVSGTHPGGTGSGPDAIFGFQHSYYVARDGRRARTFVTPDALVGDADMLQRGIVLTPVGTRYCVTIAPIPGSAPEQYRVDLVQQKPDQPPTTFHQIVTVATLSGHTRITRIATAE